MLVCKRESRNKKDGIVHFELVCEAPQLRVIYLIEYCVVELVLRWPYDL